MYTHLSWLCLCSILGAGRMVQGALLDAPSVKNFGRRSMATATVIGDFVYVDGGELTQLEDGRGSLIRAVMNSTLSIDMSKSWNSSTVTVNVISKPNGVPSRSRANIWVNAAAGEFYSWGGSHPDGKNIAEAQVWKFTANGNGGGTWSVQNLENPDILKKIHPTRGGAFANSDDTGFLIGGQTHERTELGRKDLQNIPGMLTFDMKTKVMENVTKDEFPAGSPFEGSLVSAEAHFIPNFGPNGLIMVFGGHSAPLDNKIDAHQAKAFDMETLWFFDPKTREKFSQKSTGTPPPVPRVNFCVAGFQTEDGYDIFLYGGFNDQGSKPVHMDAYILSLPGFIWIKVPDSSIIGPRQDQACVSVGKRQVLNIGGGPLGWTSQDDAPQGFAVFDMTTLEWRYSYDANAGPYERTDTLKEWYNKSSLSSVQWSSEKVKGLFATSSPKPTETSDVESKKPSAAGAIAGGVIGGVAFLAIVLAIAWWFLVRPRRRNHLNGETVGPEAKPLSYKYWNAQEVSGYQGIMELSATDRGRAELPAVERGRTELPVGTERAELPGTNEYHGLR